MNCINFGSAIFLYDWKMKFYGIVMVKDLLQSLEGMPNYDMIKHFLDGRAKDRKVFWW